MKYLKLTILSLCMSLSISVFALDVTSTAGKLKDAVGDNLNISSLKVKGQINAADFEFINYELKALRTLDLSEATIAPYNGAAGRLANGNLYCRANILPPYALMSSTINTLVLPPNVDKLGEGALAASAIRTLVIPASVTTLGDNLFSGCKSLQSIIVPSTVRLLGTGIFKDCESLASVELQPAMTEIPASMFEGCSSLKSISLPATVANLGANAFANCSRLQNVNFPQALTSIGSKAFYNTAIKDVNVSDCNKLLAIGDFAFAKCGDLTRFDMAPEVKYLGRGVFFDDAALVETSIPAAIDVIPAFTFKGDHSLGSPAYIVNNVKEIGDYALTGLSSISEIKLPETLSHIGTSAMADWAALKSIDATSLKSTPTLGDFVWDNVDQENVILYVTKDTKEQFENAPQWNLFTISTKGDVSVDNPAADPNGNIEFRLGANSLRVISTGAPIVEVLVYDLVGRRCISESASAQTVEIDITNLKADTFIVYAVLEDGTRSAVKLLF